MNKTIIYNSIFIIIEYILFIQSGFFQGSQANASACNFELQSSGHLNGREFAINLIKKIINIVPKT